MQQYSSTILFSKEQKEVTASLTAQRCLNGERSCGFFNGQESTRPIIHDSDIFSPISLIEGLPAALGNALWSTLKPKIDDFVRISWIVYLVIKLVCFVIFLVKQGKSYKSK